MDFGEVFSAANLKATNASNARVLSVKFFSIELTKDNTSNLKRKTVEGWIRKTRNFGDILCGYRLGCYGNSQSRGNHGASAADQRWRLGRCRKADSAGRAGTTQFGA